MTTTTLTTKPTLLQTTIAAVATQERRNVIDELDRSLASLPIGDERRPGVLLALNAVEHMGSAIAPPIFTRG